MRKICFVCSELERMVEKVNSSSASVIVNQTVTEEHLVSMEDDFEQVYMMLF